MSDDFAVPAQGPSYQQSFVVVISDWNKVRRYVLQPSHATVMPLDHPKSLRLEAEPPRGILLRTRRASGVKRSVAHAE